MEIELRESPNTQGVYVFRKGLPSTKTWLNLILVPQAQHMLLVAATTHVSALFFLSEKQDGTPVTLERGFMFDIKEDVDDTWEAVLHRVDAQLRRQGFTGKRVPVWGAKVRPNRRRRCCLRFNSPRR